MTFKVLTVAFSMVVICSIPNANTDEKQAATPSETLPMYQVNQDNLPEEFIRAWQYAGQHIKGKAEGDIHWMRATLDQPIAEHLSFRLGNQLFFVYLSVQKNSEWIMSYDIEDLFIRVADEANAIPCIMSMIDEGNGYKPANAGWGLLHAQTGETIDPRALVTDELIEMSDW